MAPAYSPLSLKTTLSAPGEPAEHQLWSFVIASEGQHTSSIDTRFLDRELLIRPRNWEVEALIIAALELELAPMGSRRFTALLTYKYEGSCLNRLAGLRRSSCSLGSEHLGLVKTNSSCCRKLLRIGASPKVVQGLMPRGQGMR